VLQFIVVGLVLGSIYALAASGLVITYVSTGVLNFAFGALAFFIARTYYYLNTEHGWGILSSAALCLLVVAPAMGLFLYLAIFRFLRLSSQLIKVVVTIGWLDQRTWAADSLTMVALNTKKTPTIINPPRAPSINQSVLGCRSLMGRLKIINQRLAPLSSLFARVGPRCASVL